MKKDLGNHRTLLFVRVLLPLLQLLKLRAQFTLKFDLLPDCFEIAIAARECGLVFWWSPVDEFEIAALVLAEARPIQASGFDVVLELGVRNRGLTTMIDALEPHVLTPVLLQLRR